MRLTEFVYNYILAEDRVQMQYCVDNNVCLNLSLFGIIVHFLFSRPGKRIIKNMQSSLKVNSYLMGVHGSDR